jgi:hypothetical protein
MAEQPNPGFQKIGGDPHGVSVSDDERFMRWQSAPSPEVARDIHDDIRSWLADRPEVVGGIPERLYGREVIIRRVEDERVVAEERVRVSKGRAGSHAPLRPSQLPNQEQPPDVFREVSLAEAARRADFTVFAPDRVPPNWQSYIAFLERGPRASAVVLVSYRSGERQTVLSMLETNAEGRDAADFGQLDGPPWREITYRGSPMRVRGPGETWEGALEIRRDGTLLRMISLQLDVDGLCALAVDLVPT